MDRPYYGEHAFTLARHPSETDERMMVRLLAFIMFADERLEFGRGLSAEDEPALWQKDYAGTIERWIEVGLPDERTLRKAAGRATEVVLLVYGGKAAEIWWGKEGNALSRLANLQGVRHRHGAIRCTRGAGRTGHAVAMHDSGRASLADDQRWRPNRADRTASPHRKRVTSLYTGTSSPLTRGVIQMKTKTIALAGLATTLLSACNLG